MHAVAHLVGLERPSDFVDDLLIRRYLGERKRQRRTTQPVKVLVEFEDPPVVEAQTLPYRVAPLHCRVEGADAGLVTVDQLAVDVDEEVLVLGIELLEHCRLPSKLHDYVSVAPVRGPDLHRRIEPT